MFEISLISTRYLSLTNLNVKILDEDKVLLLLNLLPHSFKYVLLYGKSEISK